MMQNLIQLAKNLPKQAYIFVLALSVYCWPWLLFSGENAMFYTAVILQLVFVMLCNILVKEPWVDAIIIVEFVCLLINTTLFNLPSLIPALHEQIMFAALIIELLIITISLQGESVGLNSRRHSRVSTSGLRICSWRILSHNSGEASA